MNGCHRFKALILGGAIMTMWNLGNGNHPAQAAAQGNIPDRKMFVDALTVEMNRFVNAINERASSNTYRIFKWEVSALQTGDPEPWSSSSDGISNTTINTTFYPVRAQTTFTYFDSRTEQKKVQLYCYYNSFREFACATVRPWEW